MKSTREYHTTKRAWTAALPDLTKLLPETEFVSELDTPLTFLDDGDCTWKGKMGTFFTQGICFYYHRQAVNNGPLVGYTRILVPHLGTLFAVLDDVQGCLGGKDCLTKSFTMQVMPQFELDKHVDFYYKITASQKEFDGGARLETTTSIELREMHTNVLMVISSGLFIRNESTRKTTAGGAVSKDNFELLWRRVAPLRLAGEHGNDPTMSFKLMLPRPQVTEIPSWWDASTIRAEPKQSPFQGRFELYSVEKVQDGKGVHAIVVPLLTAEGPPNIAHGGSRAAFCLEVLCNLLPQLRMDKFYIRYRRPIALQSKVVVEWTCPAVAAKEQQQWICKVYDWDHKLLQECMLTEQPGIKL